MRMDGWNTSYYADGWMGDGNKHCTRCIAGYFICYVMDGCMEYFI